MGLIHLKGQQAPNHRASLALMEMHRISKDINTQIEDIQIFTNKTKRGSLRSATCRTAERLFLHTNSVQVVGESRVMNKLSSLLVTGVPPPAGHSHSTDTPKVCEGEVSQVLPSCCCQTSQPAPLHIDLTLYSALHNKSVQTHF